MNKQQIEKVLSDAPEGATNFNEESYFTMTGIKKKPYAAWDEQNKEWFIIPPQEFGFMRALSDLRAQLELMNEVEAKDKRIAELENKCGQRELQQRRLMNITRQG